MYSCMLMSEDSVESIGIHKALERQSVNIIRSKPNYANYIKTLQYLPDLIVIELPRSYSNELNYLQMVKQHRVAREIPVYCYGAAIAQPVIVGLKKIGVNDYFPAPMDISGFVKSVVPQLKKRKPTWIPAREIRSPAALEVDKETSACLASSQISNKKKIDYFCENISKLMAFPFAVSKVLKMTSEAESDASDLAKVIGADPVLSAKVLAVSNSAYFGGGRNRVSSVKNAVVRIGFAETRRIVMSMSVMNIFDNERFTPGFNRLQFWYHCLAAGVMAEYFADRLPGLNKDEAFLCGLLHDFGLIILDEFAPTIFSRLVTLTTDSGAHFIDKELEIIGITHQDFVRTLFEKWNIPSHITAAVTEYARVEKMPACPAGNDWRLPVCVAHANQFSKALMLGAGCDQFVVPLPAWSWERIGCKQGLDLPDQTAIREKLKLYLELMGISFKVGNGVEAAPVSHDKITIAFLRFETDFYGPSIEYLRSMGMTVENVIWEEDREKFDNKYDLMLVEWGGGPRAVDVESLSRVYARDRSGGRTSPPKVALLIMAPKNTMIELPKQNSRCSVIYSDFDLRQLDLSIGLLLMDAPPAGESALPPALDKAKKDEGKSSLNNADMLLAEVARRLSICRGVKIHDNHVDRADVLLRESRLLLNRPEANDQRIIRRLKTSLLHGKYALMVNELRKIEKAIGAGEAEIAKENQP